MQDKRFFHALNSITRRKDAARRRELSMDGLFATSDFWTSQKKGAGFKGAFALTPLGAAGNFLVWSLKFGV